jgi:dolichyl-phosphate-mannose--protein O-mannosyl transferase
MKFEFTKFLVRYEQFIPFALFLIFLLVTVPGISWGAPSLWNPDELVWRVNMALGGEMKFDETEPNFNYPSLPKHIMYGVEWLVKQAGGSQADLIVSARLTSVLLGGLTVILIYLIAKLASKNIYVPLLAAFFALSDTALAHNARFAHNDLYLLFFLTLSLYAIIKYRLSGHRLCGLEQIYRSEFRCYPAHNFPDRKLEDHFQRLAAHV